MHLVTCAINAVQNIDKCIRRCGLETDEIILEQLASSYAVLTEDEKELGVCLVDIGEERRISPFSPRVRFGTPA